MQGGDLYYLACSTAIANLKWQNLNGGKNLKGLFDILNTENIRTKNMSLIHMMMRFEIDINGINFDRGRNGEFITKKT